MNPVPADPPPDAPTLPPPAAPSDGVTQAYTGTPPAEVPAGPVHVPGYEILGELGRGGMGVVYQARHLRLNRLVALKMILAGAHGGPEHRQRFLTEARAVAQLQHPNLVQIYETGEHDGCPYFALEFVPGGGLDQFLAGTPQPPAEAARLVETLARAMQAVHAAGIVHRDLKPANVLLAKPNPPGPPSLRGKGGDPLGNVMESSATSPVRTPPFPRGEGGPGGLGPSPKITDFGLAKHLHTDSGQTRSGQIMGTPSYMAPEQAAGRKDVGPAADVYALGAILYECLTGRPPFRAETPLDTILQVIEQEPVAPTRLQPRVPRDLETVCLKCLQKEPGRRYPSAQALADDLAHFLAGEPIAARPVGAFEKAVKWARRRPALAALALVAAAAVLALIGGGLWYNARLRDALAEADRERDHARETLHQAVAAVDRLVQRVSQGQLAQMPQFQAEQRQIAEDALAFYRGFLRQDSTDPVVRRETGRAYYRITGLHLGLSQVAEAEEACRQALALQSRLVAEFPDRPDYRNDLARTQLYLGHLTAQAAGRNYAKLAQAERTYQEAYQASQQLTRDHPGEPGYRDTLVQAASALGLFNLLGLQLARSKVYYQTALEAAETLAREHPETADHHYQVAVTASYLGLVNFRLAQQRPQDRAQYLEQADQVLARGRDWLDRNAERVHADTPGYQHARGMNRLLMGFVARARGKWAEAEPDLRAGLAVYDELVKHFPRHYLYRFLHASAHHSLAMDLYRQKRPGGEVGPALDQAVTALEGLSALGGGGEPHEMLGEARLYQGLHRAHQGDHAGAVAAIAKLPPADGLPAVSRYNLACVYAVAAGAANQDERLSDADRRRTAEELASKAMGLLQAAHKAGYPQGPKQAREVSQDPDLLFLSNREDFRQYLAEVTATLKP